MSDTVSIDIFIINLAKDTIKKEYMEKHLMDNGLSPVFIDAIYGENLTKDELEQCYNNKRAKVILGRSMGKNEIGCFLSHLSIYRKMIDDKIEHALILEDDIEINPELGNIINSIMKLSGPWQIILLGHHSQSSRNIPTPESRWGKISLQGRFTLCRPCDLAQGAYGYLINLSGAKQLIKLIDKIDKPIDLYTGSDQYTNLYIVNPPIININQHLTDNYNSMEERTIAMSSLAQLSYLDHIKSLLIIRHMILLKDSLRAIYQSIRPINKYK